MTNDEINRKVASIMEPMPSEPPYFSSTFQDALRNHAPETSPNGMYVAMCDLEIYGDSWWQPLDFCNDIAAAWRCVEWAKSKGGVTLIDYDGENDALVLMGMSRYDVSAQSADTAPMAICLAFIAAFGGEG